MIYLASASPRRAELLQQLDLDFEIYPVDIDETIISGESPDQAVIRLAGQKAEKAYHLLSDSGLDFSNGHVVLASDTLISFNNKVIGKPGNARRCREILTMLSGQTHQVLSAVTLMSENAKPDTRLSVNRVQFRQLQANEIECYCLTSEPADKAGAYAIQGKAAIFINHLQGSYSSVMGLPLFETAELLKKSGIDIIK